MSAALEVNNVTKIFRSRRRTLTAVDGVSFTVNAGEVFGLLGVNGAGKSTSIKMCTGLLDPDSGEISVYGHDVVKDRGSAKSLLNVSPQETAVAPTLTVRENLEFIAQIYGADKPTAVQSARDMMEKLKLADRANDRACKLSGGLMRRLSVGMALITKPKLVFLDEPTLGLDVLSRRELWKYVRQIGDGAAVVLTTHYLEEAQAMCDRIAIMSKGKIVAVGTADELIKLSGAASFEEAFISLAGECEVNE